MIHAELLRRGLGKHADDWKDAAFASLAVGAGAVVGMGFAPGAEIAAQNFAEHGAMTAAQYASGVATSQVAQSLGLVATETASAHYTDPDTWVHPHGRCVGVTNTGTPIFETPVLYNQPAPQYSAYGMNTNAMGGRYPVQPQWQPQMQAFRTVATLSTFLKTAILSNSHSSSIRNTGSADHPV